MRSDSRRSSTSRGRLRELPTSVRALFSWRACKGRHRYGTDGEDRPWEALPRRPSRLIHGADVRRSLDGGPVAGVRASEPWTSAGHQRVGVAVSRHQRRQTFESRTAYQRQARDPSRHVLAVDAPALANRARAGQGGPTEGRAAEWAAYPIPAGYYRARRSDRERV